MNSRKYIYVKQIIFISRKPASVFSFFSEKQNQEQKNESFVFC